MTRPSVTALGDFAAFGLEQIAQSITARFEHQAGVGGDRIAVKTPTAEVTYAELAERARRIACAVLERTGGPGPGAVGVLLGSGANAAAAILGVLGAGKAYVPLDPSYPPARLRTMLAAAAAPLILTDTDTESRARSAIGDRGSVLDVGDLAVAVGGSPGIQVSPDTAAYIFFTSGTTGEPKGVYDSHRNVLHNVLRYTNALRITSQDRLTLLQSSAFSGSVSSFFGAVLNGATSYPISVSEEGLARVAEWLQREKLTMFHGGPSIFRGVLDGGSRFPEMRVVRLEGDRASSLDVELFKRHFARGAVLANGLGTTETGLCRQLLVDHDSVVPGGVLPVGYPVRDMHVVLVDEQGHPVDVGEVGEVSVRSEFLALGYWDRPDLTEAAFRPALGAGTERVYRTGDMGRLRSDGCLEYLSRKDFQLKVRGHSIQPAEIESALISIPGVPRRLRRQSTASGASHDSLPISFPTVHCRSLRNCVRASLRRSRAISSQRFSSSSTDCHLARTERWIGERFRRRSCGVRSPVGRHGTDWRGRSRRSGRTCSTSLRSGSTRASSISAVTRSPPPSSLRGSKPRQAGD